MPKPRKPMETAAVLSQDPQAQNDTGQGGQSEMGHTDRGHDHASCLAAALSRGEQAFEAAGSRMTDLRRMVLGEIAASHTAVGAYDLMDKLALRTGKRLAPVSIYRSLEALQDLGLVHRIESRNAFVACHQTHTPDAHALGHLFLVCESCSVVAEVAGGDVNVAAAAAAQRAGFSVKRAVVEITGKCATCRNDQGARS